MYAQNVMHNWEDLQEELRMDENGGCENLLVTFSTIAGCDFQEKTYTGLFEKITNGWGFF